MSLKLKIPQHIQWNNVIYISCWSFCWITKIADFEMVLIRIITWLKIFIIRLISLEHDVASSTPDEVTASWMRQNIASSCNKPCKWIFVAINKYMNIRKKKPTLWNDLNVYNVGHTGSKGQMNVFSPSCFNEPHDHLSTLTISFLRWTKMWLRLWNSKLIVLVTKNINSPLRNALVISIQIYSYDLVECTGALYCLRCKCVPNHLAIEFISVAPCDASRHYQSKKMAQDIHIFSSNMNVLSSIEINNTFNVVDHNRHNWNVYNI